MKNKTLQGYLKREKKKKKKERERAEKSEKLKKAPMGADEDDTK
jgi:hypothetical protein